MTSVRDPNVRVSMDPSRYIDGADKVSLATKRMLREQEAADRKWRNMAAAQGAAQREDAARQQTLAAAVARAEQEKQVAYDQTGKILLAGSAAIATGLAAAAKAAISWESAWAGVTKTTDASADQLPALEAGLRNLTKVLPASHQEIAAVAEAAGQLGVKSTDVVAFTRTMIDLGETTNLTSEEAATSLAQLMNIMQTSAEDVSRLGSTLVALGNDGASTEREILDLSLRLAGASRIARISEADMLAIANAMASLGIEAEAGGTAMSMIITKVANTVRARGRDLEDFATVAGMTSDEFTAAWEERPAAAIDAFTKGLGRMNDSGGDVFGTLTDLGFTGERIRDTLLRMAGGGDMVTESLETSTKAWKENNALTAEAAKRYETTESKLAIAKNQFTEAGIELGTVLLPAIANTAEGIADLLAWFADLPAPVQTAITTLGSVAAVTGVAGAAFLMLGPRIAAARAQLAIMTTSLPRTSAALSTTAKAGGALMLALTALAAASAATTKDVALGTAEMETKVRGLASSKDVVGDLFGDLVPKDSDLKRGKDFAGFLNDMVDPGAWKALAANVGDAGVTVTRFFGDDTAKWGELKDRLAEVGTTFATLADTELTAAQRSFKALAAEAGGSEEVTADLLKTMPAYRDALVAQASAAKLSLDETSLLKLATGEMALTTQQAADVATAADAKLTEHAATLGLTKEAYDELAKAVQQQRDAWAGAAAGFVDVNGTYTSMLEERQAADQAAAEETAKARGEEGDAWKQYVTDVRVNLDEYLAELQRQADAQSAWKSNMLALADQVSAGTLDYLARLGPEGAPLVQALVDGSIEELAEFDRLGGAAMASASETWVLELEKAGPLLAAVAAEHGADAADQLRASLQSGETTVAQAAKELGYAITENLPGEYTVEIDADTRNAWAAITEFRRLASQQTVVIQARVDADPSYSPASSQNAVRRAAGGGVWGAGTETSDSIPAWLSHNEHVWTAREVRAAGGHDNVERLRRAALKGELPQYASGGPVAAWTERVANDRQAVLTARSNLKAAKKKEDDKKTAAAEKALDAAEKRYDASRDALTRSRELVRDTRVDVRRGSIREQATSGLSGGYAVVDQLVDQSRNTDLSKGTRQNLAATARGSEAALKKLYTQAEKLEGRLAAARDRVQELSQIKAGVKSALMGGFSLAESMKPGPAPDPIKRTNQHGEVWYDQPAAKKVTGKSMLADARGYAAKVKAFALKLAMLRKRGFSGAILQEVSQMGVEGGTEAADALLQLSTNDTKMMNLAYQSIEAWSGQAGQYVTEGFHKGGVAAAEGLVKGLETQQAAIEAQITKVAIGMETALKKALGIASPSKVTTRIGEHTGEGLIVGNRNKLAKIRASAEAMARAATPNLTAHTQTLANASVPTVDPALAAPNRHISISVQPMRVEMPRELVVVDASGALVGRMRVEAGRVYAKEVAAQDATAQYVGSL